MTKTTVNAMCMCMNSCMCMTQKAVFCVKACCAFRM